MQNIVEEIGILITEPANEFVVNDEKQKRENLSPFLRCGRDSIKMHLNYQ